MLSPRHLSIRFSFNCCWIFADLFIFLPTICGEPFSKYVSCLLLYFRPPERRYEQQYHSITAQAEHEALEAKRPRMETVAEAHINRTPPTAGGIVLPMPHTVQDSLRATVEVKKVGPYCFSLSFSSLSAESRFYNFTRLLVENQA